MSESIEKLVKIVFRGSDQTASAVSSVSSGFSEIKDSVSKIANPLANLTKKLLLAEGAILALGAGALGFAANESQKFQQEFANIATLTDLSTENLGGLREQILDYAKGSTQALQTISDATYNAISAGTDYKVVLESLNEAEKLSVAGKSDLNSTLKVLSQSMNSYGASSEQASEFSSALLNAVRSGVTTLPELASSLGKVTSIAANAGISFEEVTSAVAGLTFSGLSTAEAVTALRGLISGIVSPTQSAKKAFDELGIAYGVNATQSIGLSGVLDQLKTKTEGNDQAVFSLFGNIRALGAAQALTGSGFEKFNTTLDTTRKNANATQVAFDKVIPSIDTGADAFKVLAITIGDNFQQNFISAKTAITNLINAISESAKNGAIGDLLLEIKKLTDDGLNELEKFVDALPDALEQADYSGFIAGLETIRDSIGRLFDGFDPSDPEQIANVITRLGEAFDNLSTFTASVLDTLGPVIRQFAEFIVNADKLDASLVESIGQFGAYAVAIQAVMPALDGLGTAAIALAVGPTALANVGAGLATLGRSAATVTTNVAALTGIVKGGLVASVGILGYTVGDAINAVTGLSDGLVWLKETIGNNSRQTDAFSRGYAAMSAVLRQTSRDLDENASALDRLNTIKNKATHETYKEGDALKELNREYFHNGEVLSDTARKNQELINKAEAELKTRELLSKTLGQQGLIYNEVTGAWEKQAEAIKETGNAAEKIEYQFNNVNTVINEATGEVIAFRKSLEDTDESLEETESNAQSAAREIEALKKRFGESGVISAKVALDIQELEQNTELAADKIAALKVELRKAEIEARVDLEIAELENKTEIAKAQLDALTEIRIAEIDLDIEKIKQETEQVKAAFQSINEVSATVGSNIETVIGAIAGLDSADKLAREKFSVFRNQLAQENSRFDRQLDIQEKLTDAQIERLRAQSESLRRGDALIQIEGSNLPSLEQLAIEIIQQLQFRFNNDAQQLLLGVSAI